MSTFAHIMRGLGSVEAIITLFFLTVWALAFFAPDPSMPSAPRYLSHSATSITIEWDPPLHGCGNVTTCEYELSYRLDGATAATTVIGSYHPATEKLAHTVTELAQGVGYRFKVRHALYHALNQSWEWQAFTPESEEVYTSGESQFSSSERDRGHSRGRGRGARRNQRGERGGVKFNFKERARGLSLSLTKGAQSVFYVCSTAPLLWFAYRVVAPDLSFNTEGVFQRIRTDVSRQRLGLATGIAWGVTAIWVDQARELALVALKGTAYAVVGITILVMLQRLQWQCRSFDWPPLSDPVGFTLTLTLVLFIHLLFCKRLFGDWLKGELFILVSSILWFIVNAVLLALSAVLQRVIQAKRKSTSQQNASRVH